MLNIKIEAYDEFLDRFLCECTDSVTGTTGPIHIPAVMMPYVASDVYEELSDSSDLPRDLVGYAFQMVCPFLPGDGDVEIHDYDNVV